MDERMTQTKTLSEAIDQLNAAVEWAAVHGSCTGYFAALYVALAGTVSVQLEHGKFDAGDRVEAVFLHALNRYLDARRAYLDGAPVTDVWRYAFNASAASEPVVLQHLLLGLCAVLYLDLAVATLHIVPAPAHAAFQADYERLHAIASKVMDGAHQTLRQIWPRLHTLQRFIGRPGTPTLGLDIEEAGPAMWDWINQTALLTPATQAIEIVKLDRQAARRAGGIRHPGLIPRLALLAVRLSERGTVPEKLHVLR